MPSAQSSWIALRLSLTLSRLHTRALAVFRPLRRSPRGDPLATAVLASTRSSAVPSVRLLASHAVLAATRQRPLSLRRHLRLLQSLTVQVGGRLACSAADFCQPSSGGAHGSAPGLLPLLWQRLPSLRCTSKAHVSRPGVSRLSNSCATQLVRPTMCYPDMPVVHVLPGRVYDQ